MDERLYRAVFPGPMFWQDGRVTTAAFKDKQGLSTNRSLGRDEKQCIEHTLRTLRGTVISFRVEDCRTCDAYVQYDPVTNENEFYAPVKKIDENEFHTLVKKNMETNQLTRSQMVHLSKVAMIHDDDGIIVFSA